MSDFNILFSSNLNYLLKRDNMTQAELAKKLGVGTTSVYNWCSGLKTPRMDKIDKMCEIFSITRSYLIAFDYVSVENEVLKTVENQEVMARNIRHFMTINNVTAADICKALNIKPNTFSYWVNAKCYPRIDKIEMMANYFGVSKAALIEDSQQEESSIATLTSEEKDLIRAYRNSSDDTKNAVCAVLGVQREKESSTYSDNVG